MQFNLYWFKPTMLCDLRILAILLSICTYAVAVQARLDLLRGLFSDTEVKSEARTEDVVFSSVTETVNNTAEIDPGVHSLWDWFITHPGFGLVLMTFFILVTTLLSYCCLLRSWERKRINSIRNRAGLFSAETNNSYEDGNRSGLFELISLNSSEDGPPPYELIVVKH